VDHVVIGLGGLGSAAAYWLMRMTDEAGETSSVVGLEQFELGHVRGASHDHSRIIRYSYHTPGYVELARGAYEAWTEVERELGSPLVLRTGGIDMFPARGAIPIEHYTSSMRAAAVPFEMLDSLELHRRYPQFRVRDDVISLFQADTGIAPAALGTAAHQRLAAARGADLRPNTPVLRVESDGAGELTVVTADAVYRTGSLIACADAWTNELLAPLDLALPLEVTREQVVYFPTSGLDQFAPDRFPVWIWMDDPSFYGFPVYGVLDAVKAAEDVGGRTTTARTRTYDTDQASLGRLVEFLSATIPGIEPRSPRVTTCLYCLTPDRDFLLDTVPGHPGFQVGLGAGHGFKFASWFGRTLARRAVAQSPDDLSPFRFDRPALTDPSFVANYMT
jgi:sarcosine oxidase